MMNIATVEQHLSTILSAILQKKSPVLIFTKNKNVQTWEPYRNSEI